VREVVLDPGSVVDLPFFIFAQVEGLFNIHNLHVFFYFLDQHGLFKTINRDAAVFVVICLLETTKN